MCIIAVTARPIAVPAAVAITSAAFAIVPATGLTVILNIGLACNPLSVRLTLVELFKM